MFDFVFGFFIAFLLFFFCGFFFLLGIIFSYRIQQKEETMIENKFLQRELSNMTDFYKLINDDDNNDDDDDDNLSSIYKNRNK